MRKPSVSASSHTSLVWGSVTAVILAATPYFFYFYETVPVGKSWDLFFFTYEPKSYGSVLLAIWVIMNKFVPFYLCLLWFFTCKHWWYHCILIPVIMYGAQLFSAINDDIQYIDHYELYVMVPVVVAALSATYLARIVVYDRIHNIDISEIEKGIKKPSDKLL